PQVLRDLFADGTDPVQEIAALLNVNDANQAIADFNSKAVDLKECRRLLGSGGFGRSLFQNGLAGAQFCCFRQGKRDESKRAAEEQERELRKTKNQCQAADE